MTERVTGSRKFADKLAFTARALLGRGTAEYGAAMKRATERGGIEAHKSGTYRTSNHRCILNTITRLIGQKSSVEFCGGRLL